MTNRQYTARRPRFARLRYMLANFWTFTTPALAFQTIGFLVTLTAIRRFVGELRGDLVAVAAFVVWCCWRVSSVYRRLDALARREREAQDAPETPEDRHEP